MRRPFLLMVAGGLAALGCGAEGRREEVIPIDQVPAAAKAAAEKELPGLKFEIVYKVKMKDGRDAFELRGKDRRGKIREVEVTPSGEVVEVE